MGGTGEAELALSAAAVVSNSSRGMLEPASKEHRSFQSMPLLRFNPH